MKAHNSFGSKSGTILCLSEQRDDVRRIVRRGCYLPHQCIKSMFMIQHKELSQWRVLQTMTYKSSFNYILQSLSTLLCQDVVSFNFRFRTPTSPSSSASNRADYPSITIITRLRLPVFTPKISVAEIQTPIGLLYRLRRGSKMKKYD